MPCGHHAHSAGLRLVCLNDFFKPFPNQLAEGHAALGGDTFGLSL